MTRYRHGLVVGKFYPPHVGHLELIAGAAGSCDRVSVVVAANPSEHIGLGDRVEWLGWSCAGWSHVGIVGTMDDHPIDYDDPAVWDAHEGVFRRALAEIAGGVSIDAVFSGEGYGDELARRFSAAHVRCHRAPDGPSGTKLRADLFGSWSELVPAARRQMARRIVVLGAESTGTTTLAHDLAEALDGAFVPEYGRAYSAAKLASARARAHTEGGSPPWLDQLSWNSDEFTGIALRQTAAIDEACERSPLVVADTDATATGIWHRRYLGEAHGPAVELAWAKRPDLYILTSPRDVAFHQDGLRDGQSIRSWMHDLFVRELERIGVQWMLVQGNRRTRLDAAWRACGRLTQPEAFIGAAH